MTIKHWAVLAVSLVASPLLGSSGAFAAGEVYDWSGAYVGVSAGYGWNADDAQFDGLENGVVNPGGGWASYYPEVFGNKDLSADGFIGGLQAGANYQVEGGFVVGVEADISYSGIGESSSTPSPAGFFDPMIYSHDYQMDWFGTARLRAGFAFDRSLIYATGGLAIGHVSVDYVYDDLSSGDHIGSDSGTKVGWALGGGIEHALGGELSIKGEYLYYDLADTSDVSDPIIPIFNTRFSSNNTGHIVKVGLNYHF